MASMLTLFRGSLFYLMVMIYVQDAYFIIRHKEDTLFFIVIIIDDVLLFATSILLNFNLQAYCMKNILICSTGGRTAFIGLLNLAMSSFKLALFLQIADLDLRAILNLYLLICQPFLILMMFFFAGKFSKNFYYLLFFGNLHKDHYSYRNSFAY